MIAEMAMDVVQWLQTLGFEEYAASFVENRIDEEVLPLLTDEDLQVLGVAALGDRKKILVAIANLRGDDAQMSEPRSAPPRIKPKPLAKDPISKPKQTGPFEGERRQLSVMFCDLVESTKLSGQLDPEDMRDVMRQYQDAVAGCIARYDGYLAKFLGDGVLAYFGWPRAYEDQAERAVRSGLDAVAAVAEIELENGPDLHARVGIATGEVVVGDIVGEASSEAGAVTGETPNLAARLESLAEPDQVVISATTHQLVKDAFEYANLGLKTAKGFTEPVQVWQVLAEGATESRFEAAHHGELVRFVGREHELGLLFERWALTKSGEGQVVLLSGEAGIGKSRLAEALRTQIGDEPHFRLHYQCSGHHTNTAFYPIIKRLEGVAGFSREDTEETKLDKLEDLLKLGTDDVKAVAPYFAELLSLPGKERYGAIDLSAQQLRSRTIEVMIEQIQVLSHQRPVLFVMEDVQWIDPSTEDYLSELMPRTIDKAVFMLITCRSSYTPPWPRHPHETPVQLGRLGRDHGAEIVRMAGGHDLPDAIVARLVARAEGVPLYIEELTRAILEAGVSVDGGITEDQIPATLQASLVARLDRLEDAKEIAQIGSIFGREFSYDLLAAVAEKSDAEVNDALERLSESGILFRRGLAPRSIYTFKQSLLQDAAYATILMSRRRRLHASIMEVLEARSGTEIKEKTELLAYHAFHGEIWEKAFAYSREVGLKAVERSANREASALLERALNCLENVPENDENVRIAIDTHFEARSAIQALGDHERVVEHLREAEMLATKLNDQRRLGWASAYLSQYLWWMGDHEQAAQLGERALNIAPTISDISLEAVANFFLGQGYFNAGNYNLAVDYLRRNEKLLEGDLVSQRHGLTGLPSVLSHAWLAWSLCEEGRFKEAMEHGRRGLAIAEEVNQPYSIATACLAIGQVELVQSGSAQAIPLLERAVELCETRDLDVIFPMAAALLGLAYALQGEAEKSGTLLEKGEANAPAARIFDTPTSAIALGTGHLLAGNFEKAFKFAEHAAKLADDRRFRGSMARILYLIGEVTARLDAPDHEQSDRRYRQALDLAEQLGMLPLVADCHLGLGMLHQSIDKQEEAGVHFTKAQNMYREMEMLRRVELSEDAGSEATA
jgi:class 3 adenylate cyclase/tetratricopeptide (TPR) repeat protein